MRILEGHTGGVRALAYHPEGQLLASGGEDGHVGLWKPLEGIRVRRLEEHTDWVRGVAFSPDGREVVSVGWDSRLIVWWRASGKGHVREPALNGPAWSVGYSTDGSMVAIGYGIGFVRVYRPLMGTNVHVLHGHSMPVTQVVFTPDSRNLLSAGHDRAVREWDAIWGGEPRIVYQSSDWIRCLALSPRVDLIAVGGDAPGISLVTRIAGKKVAELRGHGGPVTVVAFAPDGRTLLSAGRDGMVYLWDMATCQPREVYDWGLGALYSLAVAPDGMTASVGGADGRIVVWDLD